jgi:pyruvate/2-oxoglutarate dehydrogenase complex dihydrolipoamide dehydrogenase (E3) component
VTGVALFTHVAMYQGRIVADSILGRGRAAAYEGIPRVVFADPEIAAVGLTASQAAAQGVSAATAEISVADWAARSWTYERDPRGAVGVLADRDRGVLVGAWAVAPLASEWIHYAALAIRAQIPVSVLLDQVAQFHTYTEAWLAALEQLNV